MTTFAMMTSLIILLCAAGAWFVYITLRTGSQRSHGTTPFASELLSTIPAIASRCLDPCFLTDGEGVILYVSESALAYLGYGAIRLQGSRIEELATSPETLATTWRLMHVIGRRSREFPIELKRPAGGPLKVSMTVSRLDQSGSGISLVTFTPLSAPDGKGLPCAASARLQSLLDRAPTALFEADANGVLTYFNDRYAEMHGLPRPLQAGIHISQTSLPEDREFVAALWKAAHDDQGEFEAEYRVLAADGSERWITAHACPSGSTEAPGERMVGSAWDTTEVHDALSSARSTAELLRRIVMSSPIAMIAFDQAGRVTVWNPAAEKVFGARADEVPGSPNPVELVGDETEFKLLTQRLMAGEVVVGRRARGRTKNGDHIDLSLYASPVEGESGEVCGFVVCLMDITKQVAIEEELRRSSMELRRSQEIANLGSWLFEFTPEAEPSEGVLSWSSQTYRIFGVSEGSFKVSVDSFLDLVHPDDRQRLLNASKRAIASGTEYKFDHRLVRPDGDVRIVRERACIERSPEGQPLCMVGTIQDVTEHYRLEQRLAQADRMESIGRLAGGIAHDFNNLLMVINGYADFILDTSMENSTVHRQAEEIRKAGGRAAELTNQLLTFSRRKVSQPRVVDLDGAVAEAAAMLKGVIGEDVELRLELTPGLAPVWIDPSQLNQVLINLAINARDAMPCGGNLTIRTKPQLASPKDPHSDDGPQSHVVLEIEDTGTGIEEGALPHIFEPFFTTKPEGKGTGLGLSMVHGIIEQAGGSITVSSALGHGTTFTLLLPTGAHSVVEPHHRKPSQPQKALTGGHETILVVEDQADVLEIVGLALRSKGYEVLESMSPGDAMSMCESFPGTIHLILTDIVLPGMTGLELGRLLAARRPGVRLMYMSGYPKDAVAKRGTLRADIEYLPKPFSITEIQRRVRRALDSADVAPLETNV